MSFNGTQDNQEDVLKKITDAKVKLSKWMDEFCNLYVPALKKWCKKNKYKFSDISFDFDEYEDFVPPKVTISFNEIERELYIFELPFKKGDNYNADGIAADICIFCNIIHPDLTLILRNFVKEKFFSYISNHTDIKIEEPAEIKKEKLKLIGFYKETSYLGDNYKYEAIYPYMQDKESEYEKQVCQYLNEGLVLIPSGEIVKDVISPDHEKIGQLNFLTDGYFMWPSDLSYYVRKYHLQLNDEVIQIMKANNWHVKIEKIDYSMIDFDDYR